MLKYLFLSFFLCARQCNAYRRNTIATINVSFCRHLICLHPLKEVPAEALWLRRCVTSRTVPRSIPSGVTGFFSDVLPSDLTTALRSNQPLVKMSTRNIPGGKEGRCVRLTTSSPLRAEYRENLGA
jgi:hypothetical protein